MDERKALDAVALTAWVDHAVENADYTVHNDYEEVTISQTPIHLISVWGVARSDVYAATFQWAMYQLLAGKELPEIQSKGVA